VLNASRFDPEGTKGFYESYFQRANHRTQPLAFWIRYTVFNPRGRPDDAVGQLWAVFFDGTTGRNVALKHSVPVSDCSFSPSGLRVRIGEASLDDRGLRGCISQERADDVLGPDVRGRQATAAPLGARLVRASVPRRKGPLRHGHSRRSAAL